MKILKNCALVVVIIGTNMVAQINEKQNASLNDMYVGTYTRTEGHVDGKAEGIYLVRQNPDNGDLKLVRTVAEVVNPSFVKVGRMGRYLFAVSELGSKDAETGYIYSYEICKDGSLTEISKLPTGGLAPCHIAIDRSGKYVFVSNYMGGVVAEYKLMENGELEKIRDITMQNSESSHTHSVKISGDNRYAYIADLGNDKIWIYDFDPSNGEMTLHEQEFVKLDTGAGPRHLSSAKNGSYIYSMNELNSTVSAFKVLKNGGLELIQTIKSLPEDYKNKNSGADIHTDPTGRFLYASNRGHESIAIFKIEASSGMLSLVDHAPVAGKTPRNFTISPFGKYLYAASQDTGNITTFTINKDSGKLKIKVPVFDIKTPVCLEFVK